MTTYLQFSKLSPFSLKARLLCRVFGLPARPIPESGNPIIAARFQAKMKLATRGLGRCLHRSACPLDELPLVPWLFPEHGGYLCDSTEIGLYLERTRGIDGRLTPKNPACAYAARLIEEAVDEVGLYALHHMRWVASGRTTTAMAVLEDEVAGSLGRRAAKAFTSRFGPRQVRRLAYLFSVGDGSEILTELPPPMRPPSREGFPPTHRLLETIWEQLVDAVEFALTDGRRYLFGEGMTLADAALIGNLGSTLSLDPEAAARLEKRAPRTAEWLRKNLNGPLALSQHHDLDEAHKPLLEWASEAFLPLMKQNAEAYALCPKERGGPRNEKAFDAGINLFDGELLSHPYRTVVKDFQVKVYQELKDLHAALSPQEKQRIMDFSASTLL